MTMHQLEIEPLIFDTDPVTDEAWPMPEPFTWAPQSFDLERMCEEARQRLADALEDEFLAESFEIFAEGRNAYWLMVARHEGLAP